jgi:hypothetical protein
MLLCATELNMKTEVKFPILNPLSFTAGVGKPANTPAARNEFTVEARVVSVISWKFGIAGGIEDQKAVA